MKHQDPYIEEYVNRPCEYAPPIEWIRKKGSLILLRLYTVAQEYLPYYQAFVLAAIVILPILLFLWLLTLE